MRKRESKIVTRNAAAQRAAESKVSAAAQQMVAPLPPPKSLVTVDQARGLVHNELKARITSFRHRQLNLAESTLDITEAAQVAAGEALQTLIKISSNEKGNVHGRIKAAAIILERAIGKAGPADTGGSLPDPSTMTDEEIESRVLESLADRYEPEEIAAMLGRLVQQKQLRGR